MFLRLYMSYIRLAILRGGYARLVYEFSIGGVFIFLVVRHLLHWGDYDCMCYGLFVYYMVSGTVGLHCYARL
jgi:hypothetical protein